MESFLKIFLQPLGLEHFLAFLARFGIGRSFAKKLNLCVQTEKKE
jgi:hypothetical protein